MPKLKPNHFAVEDIIFYGMDEEGEIVVDEQGNQVDYRLKKGIRFKPLEYLCEDMSTEIMEEDTNDTNEPIKALEKEIKEKISVLSTDELIKVNEYVTSFIDKPTNITEDCNK